MEYIRPSIMELPDELLSKILDQLDQPLYSERLDRREYLSQESFSLPVPLSRFRARDIASFRSTCRRFAEIGGVHQFARITTRFTQRELEQLEKLSSWPHLARNVKKFSYLVKSFYVEGFPTQAPCNPPRWLTRLGSELLDTITPDLESRLGPIDLSLLKEKVREQHSILRSEQDLKTLCKALDAFKNLQHVQILRVQDQDDDALLRRLRQDAELVRFLDVEWAPACAHSTRTVAAAIMTTQSPCSRFSSPMLSPQSAQVLATPIPKFLTLAEKLTSLELHFDDAYDLDNKMISLSEAFKTLFTAARDMQAIHIGFPSHKPLNLKLEDVFHHVRWEKLAAFGIQAWRLDANEIIELARRHRGRLRGLRLRDVLLRDGSTWREVLEFLRNEMYHLDWVSLRRIGYASHFDRQWAAAGAEVPDEVPGGASDSEEDADSGSESGILVRRPNGIISDDESSFGEGDDQSDHHTLDDVDEDGPLAYAMEFPEVSDGPDLSLSWCTCSGQELYPHELADDGIFVSNARRKLWEQWVVHRCPQHGRDV